MFIYGQRWYSEAEPELGLGLVLEMEGKQVKIEYSLANETRVYNAKSAPLKRFKVEQGEELNTILNEKLIVDTVHEKNEIFFYACGDLIIPEMELSSELDLNGPIERIRLHDYDSPDFYQLRYDSYLQRRHYEAFKYKGFLGPKVRLIPHQIYVARTILEMDQPKVMLCDEVGLGKTIEACLVLNGLLQRELIRTTLLIVPESLVNQWFVELYRKFNISAVICNDEEDKTTLIESPIVIVSNKLVKEHPGHFILQRKWDSLVIDESHQFNFDKKEEEAIQKLIAINESTFCSLLLSATPEILGAHGLYAQLNFLDPYKYDNFDVFQNHLNKSQEISQLIQEELDLNHPKLSQYFSHSELESFEDSNSIKQALVDRYGTGRNYFRNSRQNLEKYSRLFNDRVLHAKSIEIPNLTETKVLESKLEYLVESLYKYPSDKILVICHSKKVVLHLQRKLLEIDNFKLAIFHSDQSTIERDRQAAYFAEDNDGAQILISTEVGSEGRNFEFAKHIILLDLPLLPDQLEQRIGRLDRIGQKNDINIHVPYIKDSFEEILYLWYHRVLNAFESSPKAANTFYETHHEIIQTMLKNPKHYLDKKDSFNQLESEYKQYSKEIEKGRDLLIEVNSYNDGVAKLTIGEIEHYHQNTELMSYLENSLDRLGIILEELDNLTYSIRPSETMRIPSLPGLNEDGLILTMDRDNALKFDYKNLLSWEHPLVKNIIDVFIQSSLGNVSVQNLDNTEGAYFEFILSLYCQDEFKHESQKYLPYTPVRVLVNAQGKDETKLLSKKKLDSIAIPMPNHLKNKLHLIPKDIYKELSKKAHIIANSRIKVYKDKAIEELNKHYKHEFNRIHALRLDHDQKEKMKSGLQLKLESITTSIQRSKVSLDAFRMCFSITKE